MQPKETHNGQRAKTAGNETPTTVYVYMYNICRWDMYRRYDSAILNPRQQASPLHQVQHENGPKDVEMDARETTAKNLWLSRKLETRAHPFVLPRCLGHVGKGPSFQIRVFVDPVTDRLDPKVEYGRDHTAIGLGALNKCRLKDISHLNPKQSRR